MPCHPRRGSSPDAETPTGGGKRRETQETTFAVISVPLENRLLFGVSGSAGRLLLDVDIVLPLAEGRCVNCVDMAVCRDVAKVRNFWMICCR